jgi:hypothetical protein
LLKLYTFRDAQLRDDPRRRTDAETVGQPTNHGATPAAVIGDRDVFRLLRFSRTVSFDEEGRNE